jgi:bacillithiol biosynthesis cysteine-adding enzyme BshC
MPNDCMTYQDSGYFSKLIVDYLDQKPELEKLYHRYPSIENFKEQIEEKSSNFSPENRHILVDELLKQYRNFEVSDATSNHIQLLKKKTTFSITTGHQLNLFTGPLYFLYKIISAINLCKQLKENYPEYDFVPVYWMATEDHDFEEINFFNFKNSKIKWNRESFGPVGRLSTSGLDEVLKQFSDGIGKGENAEYLLSLFHKSYIEHGNLADATRFLANELFKNEGLVIVDGDSVALKKLFVPYAKKELVQQTSFQKVNETNILLNEYKIQVNPREINLFYLEDNLRERIILGDGRYKINGTKMEFTEAEILSLLEKHPEKFSPNVILRPLYQEVILPNLVYIGGGGEIAYWLELKSNFDANKIPFPMLLLRNSVVFATSKQVKKMNALALTWGDLFSSQQDLFNKKTKEFSQFTIDFTEQKEHLKKQFAILNQMASRTNISFSGAVNAQEAKQIKGLENLEKRLLKAEKKIHADKLERIVLLQNELFPNQSLQERKMNFSELYLEFGNDFISQLIRELKPLENEFNCITL